MILGGQKSPRNRQVKNVWLPGHKQDPAERRTNAKIIKKFRTAEVYLTFRRSVYARHFAKSAFDEMEIYFSLNIHPSCYFS